MRYAFEWDPEKARSNEQKHGVSFDEAQTVFKDVFAAESSDVDHSTDEDRFIIVGVSAYGHLLVVAFTLRGENTIRIISARRARPLEQARYEEQSRR